MLDTDPDKKHLRYLAPKVTVQVAFSFAPKCWHINFIYKYKPVSHELENPYFTRSASGD
jgi:hypothetical protein